MILALLVGFVSSFLVILGGILAYRDNFFSPRQMIEKKGFAQGLPWAGHGGMWGDLIFINPILTLITTGYASQWAIEQAMIAGAFGLTASVLLHFLVYTKGRLPGCHAYHGRLTPSGWVHLVYMAGAFMWLIMFYFCTANVEPTFLITVDVLILIHWTVIGSNVLLSLLDKSWFPEKPLRDPFFWLFSGVVCGLITWRSYAIFH